MKTEINNILTNINPSKVYSQVILEHLDHTFLKMDARKKEFKSFMDNIDLKLLPYSVCVNSLYVEEIPRNFLGNKCAVAGGFPYADIPHAWKDYQLRWLKGNGIDEVDIVAPLRYINSDNKSAFVRELSDLKKTCGDMKLKVILETGVLGTVEQVSKATEWTAEAGVDFVKTSTGMRGHVAQPDHVLAMILTLNKMKSKCGIKVSGGVRSLKDAELFFELMKHRKQKLSSNSFRIGASALYTEITKEIVAK